MATLEKWIAINRGLDSHRLMIMKPIAAILIGALLTVFARPMATGANKAKQDRLAKLKAGDEEAFFEERRSLEAYPVKAVWFRVFGIVLIAYGAAFLFLGH